jgi:nicotinamidase-related amidase
MNRALIVIDMQKYFHKGTAGKLMDNVVDKINGLVDMCRGKQIPVIWIRHSNKGAGLIEGKECFEYIDSLKPDISEIKITKRYGNGFKDTELGKVLTDRGIKRIYVCGFAAEACVHNTYKGGVKLKYETLKITDAIASTSNMLLSIFNKFGEGITSREVKKSIS